MRKVTTVSSGRGRNKQTRLYLDGKPAFTAEKDRQDELPALPGEPAESGSLRVCLNAALRFLSYRPRSEHEVKQRLQRGGFESGDISTVLVKLKERGLLDDAVFARSWMNDRSTFKPRSKRLIRLELRQKGIDRETIEQIIGDTSDFDSASRVAEAKARSLSYTDKDSFISHLSQYLRRRGFDCRVINQVVEQAWQEHA